MNKISFKHVVVPALLVVTCTALTGCNSKSNDGAANKSLIIPALQAQLTSSLKDPSSVQFRNESFYQTTIEHKDGKVPSTVAVCGEINAKNSYGAYVGFRRYFSMGIATMTGDGLNPQYKDSFFSIIDNNDNPVTHAGFEKNYAEYCQNKTVQIKQ